MRIVVCSRDLATKDAYKTALKINLFQNRVLFWQRQLYTMFTLHHETFVISHVMYDQVQNTE